MSNPAIEIGKTDPSRENTWQFIQLSRRYASFAAQAGVTVVPFRDPALPTFSSLTRTEQSNVLGSLSQRVSICESAASQGGAMADAPTLTWAALKAFGLRPPSDLFNPIQSDSIIEMHSPEGKPIFQSFNYYRLCSYSLEEMYCGHWTTLYERPEWISPLLTEFVKKVFSGELEGIVKMEVPTHVVRETHSSHRYAIELTLEWGAALYSIGSSTVPAASIVVDRAKLVGERNPSRSHPTLPELPLF